MEKRKTIDRSILTRVVHIFVIYRLKNYTSDFDKNIKDYSLKHKENL